MLAFSESTEQMQRRSPSPLPPAQQAQLGKVPSPSFLQQQQRDVSPAERSRSTESNQTPVGLSFEAPPSPFLKTTERALAPSPLPPSPMSSMDNFEVAPPDADLDLSNGSISNLL